MKRSERQVQPLAENAYDILNQLELNKLQHIPNKTQPNRVHDETTSSAVNKSKPIQSKVITALRSVQTPSCGQQSL